MAPALAQAASNFRSARHQLGEQIDQPFGRSPVTTSLCRADLNSAPPFATNSFDRVVCNLVIGYLSDPLFTLKELLRVLIPDGKLIVTNLKPQADLSLIYRNFVSRAKEQAERNEARELLNNSGKIKQAEGDGLFQFLHREDFRTPLPASGVVRPEVPSAFANQAFIAVGHKPSGDVDANLVVPPNGLPRRKGAAHDFSAL